MYDFFIYIDLIKIFNFIMINILIVSDYLEIMINK